MTLNEFAPVVKKVENIKNLWNKKHMLLSDQTANKNKFFCEMLRNK